MKQLSRVIAPLILALGLAVVLVVYALVVNDLPERVYTPVQQEFLSYNRGRIIVQEAPTLNYLMPGGEVMPAVMIGDEHTVRATLAGRYEERDRVSATVYDLDFRGDYHLAHAGELDTLIEWFFPFPANLETLHDVRLLVDEQEPEGVEYRTEGIRWATYLDAGEEHEITIRYRAEGASSFSYSLPRERRIDVDVVASVEGLLGSVSESAYLRPTSNREFQQGEVFAWTYENLIADRDIQLTLPVRMSFAQRVAALQDDFRAMSRVAPVLVLTFVAALAIVLRSSGIRLRPEVYLLTGLGLALFYPLVTFLSGLVDVTAAAALSVAIISGLLITFLGRAAGWRYVCWPAGLLLLVFLGFFSLGMLTPWRGLALTSGAVLVAGLLMNVLTGRPASATFSTAVAGEPLAADDNPVQEGETQSGESQEQSSQEIPIEPEMACAKGPEPELSEPFCPFCGTRLGHEFHFCPACGQKTDLIGTCPACGTRQFVAAGQERVHCLACGAGVR